MVENSDEYIKMMEQREKDKGEIPDKLSFRYTIKTDWDIKIQNWFKKLFNK